MTTRIVVIADTHVPGRARELPPAVLLAADEADLIVHLGDFTGMQVVHELRKRAPLEAVYGNNDSEEVRSLFSLRRDLVVEGRRLALIHGHVGGRTALAAARTIADVDAVFFGHSHQPRQVVESGILLFNPGSPTDRRWAPSRTYGILTIGDTVSAQLIHLP